MTLLRKGLLIAALAAVATPAAAQLPPGPNLWHGQPFTYVPLAGYFPAPRFGVGSPFVVQFGPFRVILPARRGRHGASLCSNTAAGLCGSGEKGAAKATPREQSAGLRVRRSTPNSTWSAVVNMMPPQSKSDTPLASMIWTKL
jgi:hypothetical protein